MAIDPLTLATSFGAIAGLLADFVSGRRAGESQAIDEYVDWLRRHEHQQLADAIAGNADLSRSIQTLLAGQHDAVMAKLTDLDKVMTSVAQNLPDFSGIAAAVRQDSFLSDQCISILRQLHQADAIYFFETRVLADLVPRYTMVGGKGGEIRISEPKFITHDLEMLCRLNLLTLELSQQLSKYFVTRAGDRLGSRPSP